MLSTALVRLQRWRQQSAAWIQARLSAKQVNKRWSLRMRMRLFCWKPRRGRRRSTLSLIIPRKYSEDACNSLIISKTGTRAPGTSTDARTTSSARANCSAIRAAALERKERCVFDQREVIRRKTVWKVRMIAVQVAVYCVPYANEVDDERYCRG